MSAWLARAESWLLEPPEPAAPAPEVFEPPPQPPVRPVVAVVGLGRGCGATTVARALAVELALRDPAGAAIVTSERLLGGAPALGTAASVRLARSLRALGCTAVRATGRLCLVREAVLPSGAQPAPLVLDAGREATGSGGADRTLLVAGPDIEPALALVVAASLEHGGRPPALIANRIEEPARWQAIGAFMTGESRLAAGLARAGREPRGQLGAAMRELVDGWEREGW
ncbi:MAG: hypothetical protein ACJ77M_14485 [Thermoleophilaceae bacterium]